jgi:hypothetical protein
LYKDSSRHSHRDSKKSKRYKPLSSALCSKKGGGKALSKTANPDYVWTWSVESQTREAYDL